jgi:hypothetical protein
MLVADDTRTISTTEVGIRFSVEGDPAEITVLIEPAGSSGD